MKHLFCCMNWKVVGGLALVGLAVLALAPNLILGVLPVLLVLACPLSMLLMMPMMMKGMGGEKQSPAGQPDRVAPLPNLTREEQLDQLKNQLGGLKAQHEWLAGEIGRAEIEKKEEFIPALNQAEALLREAKKGARS